MAATVTQSSTSFKNVGVFRTKSDLVGMSWFAEDTLSHIDFRYATKTDFSNIVLSYTYNISGYTPLMDANLAPTITIRTADGGEYYVRLWNYVVNRPADSWEVNASEYLGENVYFPQGRTPGNATGTTGNIVLDFNNLYAGWNPYIWQDLDGDGTGEWVANPDWVQVPVNNISEIMWSFVPLNYNDGTGYQEDSLQYSVEFSNWQVSGNCTIGAEAAGCEVTQVRLCDDYDDIYNMTPERVVSEYERLGYREIVNCYIGASHYYDKYYYDGKMNVKTNYPFNQAFEAWYGDYLSRLHALGINVIHSISMECVDPPESWKQRNWAGVAGTTNWDPKPSLLSFVNYDVKMFYMKYVVELARLSSERGMQPMIQLGESWWWYIEDGVDNTPCFYDSATLYEYKYKYGVDMHVFKTGNDSIIGHEDVLYFLRDKNGEFTHLLRDTVKAAYPNTLFTVLFFPPSVMDKTRTPKMMSIVNLPVTYWAYPKLDFFMLEDYDYLIDGHMWKHYEAINFVQNNLVYPTSLIHYFAGFVLNSSKLAVWQNINQAIIDGFNQQFGQVYVWAYAQVKRDGWHPPVIVSASPKPGNYAEPQNVTLSVPTGCQISYTTDGSTMLTADASNSGSIYIDKSTTVHVTATKGDKQNVYDLTYTVPMREVGYSRNCIDGNPEDWADDIVTTTRNGETHVVYGKMDAKFLYVMAEGSNFDNVQELNLFIDLTGYNTSGFRDMGWKNAGIDYKVTNNVIYKYAGTGSEFIWEEVGTVPFARTYSCVEWAIPLSVIHVLEPRPLYIGFSRNYEEYAPIMVDCEGLNPMKCIDIAKESTASGTFEKYVVLPKVLNVRDNPSTDGGIIQQLYPADRVKVMFTSKDATGKLWAAIDLGDEGMGWVSDDYILPDEPVVTENFPEILEVKVTDGGEIRTYIKYPATNWGINGNFSDGTDEKTGERYNIAVAPKLMNPKYPDSGQVNEEEILAYNRYMDVIVRNKNTGEYETIYCYIESIKAHSYTEYPDSDYMDGYNGNPIIEADASESVENGYCQTGIRYPYAINGYEFAEDNIDGSIIEFCKESTGGIDCSEYELVRTIAYFKEES